MLRQRMSGEEMGGCRQQLLSGGTTESKGLPGQCWKTLGDRSWKQESHKKALSFSLIWHCVAGNQLAQGLLLKSGI